MPRQIHAEQLGLQDDPIRRNGSREMRWMKAARRGIINQRHSPPSSQFSPQHPNPPRRIGAENPLLITWNQKPSRPTPQPSYQDRIFPSRPILRELSERLGASGSPAGGSERPLLVPEAGHGAGRISLISCCSVLRCQRRIVTADDDEPCGRRGADVVRR